MSEQSIVIVAAKRTPMGGFMGGLSPLAATDLGAEAIKAALEGVQPDVDEEVIMGCVLPAGQGQFVGRQDCPAPGAV